MDERVPYHGSVRVPTEPRVLIVMVHRPATGRSVVTRRAIEEIVAAAVRHSYGVVGFADRGIRASVVRRVTGREPGIDIAIDGSLRIGLALEVASGLPVAEVARQVDSAVRYAVRRDLRREVGVVSITVAGLEYRPGRIPEVPVATPTDTASESSPAADAGTVVGGAA
ncbi:MAG: Asp23/Gls24 family envelope stress response protein [Chloroflexi bacterium]|nr:Asp23/Gls24 family envelope stress response protein [Chloroflexota bacterium]